MGWEDENASYTDYTGVDLSTAADENNDGWETWVDPSLGNYGDGTFSGGQIHYAENPFAGTDNAGLYTQAADGSWVATDQRLATGTQVSPGMDWSTVTTDGKWDLAKLAAKGLTLAGAIDAFNRARNPPTTGYQGGIPNFTATRDMVPTADTARPGAGGQRYFTDTAFSLPATATTASGLPAAQAAVASQKAALTTQNQLRTPVASTADPAVTAAAQQAAQDKFFGRTTPAAPAAQPPLTMATNTGSMTPQQKALYYNNLIGKGYSDAQIRTAAGPQTDENWNALKGLATNPPAAPVAFTPEKQYVPPAGTAAKFTPEQPFVLPAKPIRMAAQGGLMGLAQGGSTNPRYLRGKTDGMADKIPARIDGQQKAALAHGEFVVPADVVSHLGNGNSDAGADVLYKMMDKIRKARTGTKKQGKQIDPNKFTPGGLAYAAGGAVKHFVIGGPTVPAGTVGTESNLSNWAGPYVTDMLGKGQALSTMPYQAYQGPLSAGDSSLQTQAYGMAGGLQTPTSIGQAAGTAGNIATAAGGLNYQPTGATNQFTAPGQYNAAQNTSAFTQPGQYTASQNANAFATPTNTGYTSTGVDKTTASASPNVLGGTYTATDSGAFGATAANAGASQQAAGTGFNATNAGAFGATAANAGTSQQAAGTGFNATNAGAFGATAANAGTSQQAAGTGYAAANANAFGANAAQTGYNPASGLQNYQMGPASSVGARQFTDPGVASSYMNPYLKQALDPQLQEARRQSQISQQATNAQATQAGAFGGSRSAILGAENQRNLSSNLANITGQGYNTAYTTGQNQFNADQGRDLTAQQANQAAGMNVGGQNLQANLGVQALGAQYGSQMALANLSNLQQSNLQSSSQAQQAALANQAAANQSGQFGAAASNQARLANQQAANQMAQYNAGLGQAANLQTSAQAQQAALANAGYANQASQFGAAAGNTASLANQQAANQMAQYNAGLGQAANLQTSAQSQQAALANAGYANQASQFGAAASNQANLANQQATNQMAQYNAGLGQAANLQTSAQSQQAALANAGYRNQASQFGAAAGNTAALANQQSANQMAQYNAGLGQAANLANQNATNQAAQFGAQQGMTAAQLSAQYGLSAQQANEMSRQFGANYGMQGAQTAAQYGLSAQNANEASRQFGAQYGLQGAQSTAQYGQAAQAQNAQDAQFGASFGLQGLNTQLQAAQAQGNLGNMQNQAGLANLNAISGLGATQQATQQAGIAADQAAFNQERDNPYKMVQYQQSLLQGLPLAAQQYNTSTNPYYAAAGAAADVGKTLGVTPPV